MWQCNKDSLNILLTLYNTMILPYISYYYILLFKYNFSRTTVKFTGAKNWNEMPNKIKNFKTLNQFRRL